MTGIINLETDTFEQKLFIYLFVLFMTIYLAMYLLAQGTVCTIYNHGSTILDSGVLRVLLSY